MSTILVDHNFCQIVWLAWFNSDICIKYERTCQPSIKIISIEKTFALHKSAQKKHFFLEFFLKESSWWTLLNHIKIENFEKWLVFTLDDTLKRVPWSSAYTFDNADDVWAHWRTRFKGVLDQHVPLKKKWIRGDQLPWIPPDLLHEISHRNKLFKRHKRNPTSTSWDDYKRQRNKVTSLKRNALKRFCCDASLSARHPGQFWRKNEAPFAN